MLKHPDIEFIIADNQPITRRGILSILKEEGDDTYKIIANKSDLIHCLSIISKKAIVIIDYTLFDLQSLDALINIGLRYQETRWIIFSSDLSEPFLRRAIAEENYSIVTKDASIEEIWHAINENIQGRQYICKQIQDLRIGKTTEDEHQNLTPVEKEILKSIAAGKTSQEIANDRCSSIHTIATHRKNIFRKIGVNNVLEATRYAVKSGLVNPSEYYI